MKKTFLSIASILTLAFFLLHPAKGESSQKIVLGWRASTYAPQGYQGKNLPTGGSLISASVVLIQDGKPTDLSGHMIMWYLNDDLIDNGTGLQTTSFRVPTENGVLLDLRVELDDFDQGVLLKTVTIPVVPPQVVIDAPFPADSFAPSEINLFAKPFFFTTIPSNLAYSWTVNGSAAQGTDNPDKLTIKVLPGTNPGFKVGTELSVNNPREAEESTGNSKTLTYNP